MVSNLHNRLRQLKGLVTIDAWHTRRQGSAVVDLHAYVFFREARLGGQAEDDIAFKMVLRQAEIRVSQTEPPSFDIDPAEVWRGDEDPTGRILWRQSKGSETATGVEASAELSATPRMGGKGEMKRAARHDESVEIETNQPLTGINVSYSGVDRRHPVWTLRPTGFRTSKNFSEPVLEGQPWSAKQQRLLQLTSIQGRPDQSDVIIKIACRREDLHFYDIHVRDRAGELVPVLDEAPQRVAIEEFLKNCLIREGLPAGDLHSMFAIIILGDVVSEPRNEGDDG